MARHAAMLLTEIWQEPTWRALSRDAQWLYMFLLSQPDLSHCGVISLRPGRWARAAADTSAQEVMIAAKDLESVGYVVCDEDTEELLVRALLRRDRVYLQPNLMRAALASLPTIQSPVILRVVRLEIERIMRENGDHVRLERGESPLSNGQKSPLTQFALRLRAIGAPASAVSSQNGGSVNPSGNPSGEGAQQAAGDQQGLDVPGVALSWENRGSVNPSANPSSQPGEINTTSHQPAPPLTSENEGGANPSGNPLGIRGKGLGSALEVVTPTTEDLKAFPQDPLVGDALLPAPAAAGTPARRAGDDGPFATFWKAYPHKRDKDAARRAWDKITRGPHRVPTPVLIAAAGHYAQSREVADGYAKYPATFLNKGSWRDFVHGQPAEVRPSRGTDAKIARHLATRPEPSTPERDPWN